MLTEILERIEATCVAVRTGNDAACESVETSAAAIDALTGLPFVTAAKALI
jgi:hypothetical protein